MTRDVYRQTGLIAGTPVAIGGGDGCCATRGAGVAEPGIAYTNTSKTFDGYECSFDENGVWSNPPYIDMPSLVSVTSPAPKTAQLTWEQQDVDGYEIFRCGTEDGEYRRVLAVKNPKTTTHTIDTLKSGKTYYFKIRGYKTVLDLKVYSNFIDILQVTTL